MGQADCKTYPVQDQCIRYKAEKVLAQRKSTCKLMDCLPPPRINYRDIHVTLKYCDMEHGALKFEMVKLQLLLIFSFLH